MAEIFQYVQCAEKTMNFAQIVQKILSFLEKLPYILVSYGIGKRLGQAEKNQAEKELLLTKIDLERKKNELKVIDKYAGKSDDDIINDAVKSGRMFELKRKEDSGEDNS